MIGRQKKREEGRQGSVVRVSPLMKISRRKMGRADKITRIRKVKIRRVRKRMIPRAN